MKVFEITFPGFDGATSETDTRVKWVAASAIGEVLAAVPRSRPCRLEQRVAEEDIDYVLPRDAAKLKHDFDHACSPHIVLIGNPHNGFVAVGPFNSESDAVRWKDEASDLGDDCATIMELCGPTPHESSPSVATGNTRAFA